MNGFDILDKLTNEELEVIVKLIIEKGWQTESLSKDKEYKKYYPDHKKYVDKIKKDLKKGFLLDCDTLVVSSHHGPCCVEHHFLELVLN